LCVFSPLYFWGVLGFVFFVVVFFGGGGGRLVGFGSVISA